jgi:cell wall-associated NlpC family hydrolase
MLRIFKISVSFVLALSLLASAAAAQFSAPAETTGNLRLRAEPSLSANVLATAPGGSQVTVTREEPIVNRDGTWLPVTFNGISGYMSAEFLSTAAQEPESSDSQSSASGIAFIAIGKTLENLRLRSEPSLSGNVLATASKGASVAVTHRNPTINEDGSWLPVLYNGTAGYMSADFIDVLPIGNGISETGFINRQSVNKREHPSSDSSRVSALSRHAKVEITGVQVGWFSVRRNGVDGFVRADLVTLATDGFDPTPPPPPRATAAAGTAGGTAHAKAVSTLDSAGVTDVRRQIVELSFNYLGKPYRFAATGPNAFDCSGLMVYLFRQFGISINRSSADQYRNTGTSVSKGSLLPGDLVYFRTTSRNAVTHVGLYIGGGQFIHSSSGRSRSVVIDSINTGFYRDRYVGAKRVL